MLIIPGGKKRWKEIKDNSIPNRTFFFLLPRNMISQTVQRIDLHANVRKKQNKDSEYI